MDTVTVDAPVDARDHHTVFVVGFVLPVTQRGTGSVDCVVAAKLSTVPVKLLLVMGIAFKKLSLAGGGLG